MAKQSSSAEARAAILRGVDKVADAVKVTLGPKGREVVIQAKAGSSTVTRDGVTVAGAIEPDDTFENLGARMMRDVALKTSNGAGDGTTTATVLAQAIYRGAAKAVTAGATAAAVREGIDLAVRTAMASIDALATPAEARDLVHVGTISAGNDGEIGRILAEAMGKVGRGGVIMVEDADAAETTLEMVDGMRFDRGYLLPFFATDMETMEAVFENARILLCETKISSLRGLLPVLDQAAREGRPLLIVAEEVEGDALAALVVRKMRGTLRVAAVKAPGFGDGRKAVLEDLAVLTGGRVIAEDPGTSLEEVIWEELGEARKVVITMDDTTVVTGASTAERRAAIAGRVELIRGQIADASSDHDRERLEERLAVLAGGLAVIRVGAATEAARKVRKARVQGALRATRAAVEEGVVAGGGVALLLATAAVERIEAAGDLKVGVGIVRRALEEPARQIARNARRQGWAVTRRVLASGSKLGFNAATGNFEDLVAAGVIDPAKVTKTALLSASTIADLLLIDEAPAAVVPASPALAGTYLDEGNPSAFEKFAPAPGGTRGRPAGDWPREPPPPPPLPRSSAPPDLDAEPAPPDLNGEPAPPDLEAQRYTDLTIYEGHFYPIDLPAPAPPQVKAPLRAGEYTLEVAIRQARTGIDAEKEAPRSVINPRRAKEPLRIYVLATSHSLEIVFPEPLATLTWPFDSDSDTALLRFEVGDPPPGKITQGTVELSLYDESLDLLDVVELSLAIAPGDLDRLGNPDGPPPHLQYPERKAAPVRPDPEAPQRSLSIKVDAAPDGFRFTYLFSQENRKTVEIPVIRDIREGDLNDLLVRVRNFWTGLVITNYAGQLTVTRSTFERYLDTLRDLGLQAWSLLFGTRYADQKGASERLGELLAAMGLRIDSYVQITYTRSAGSFIFPWSILYPPAQDAAVDPMHFWGARYRIEQVSTGPQVNRLLDEPITVLFALDSGFGNSADEEKLLRSYGGAAAGRLRVTGPVSDEATLFGELSHDSPAHLHYFYCHGYAATSTAVLRPDGVQLLRRQIEALPEESAERQALETLLGLTARMNDESWMFIGGAEIRESKLKRQPFFTRRRPIVFLNMCQSADLLPSMSSGLVRVFLDHNASAVVGTESPMTAVFAHAFAEVFLGSLFGGDDVGTALLKARRHFLGEDRRNPLGLAYTLYGRATASLGSGPVIPPAAQP
jgi:chaperonin GroEL